EPGPGGGPPENPPGPPPPPPPLPPRPPPPMAGRVPRLKTSSGPVPAIGPHPKPGPPRPVAAGFRKPPAPPQTSHPSLPCGLSRSTSAFWEAGLSTTMSSHPGWTTPDPPNPPPPKPPPPPNPPPPGGVPMGGCPNPAPGGAPPGTAPGVPGTPGVSPGPGGAPPPGSAPAPVPGGWALPVAFGPGSCGACAPACERTVGPPPTASPAATITAPANHFVRFSIIGIALRTSSRIAGRRGRSACGSLLRDRDVEPFDQFLHLDKGVQVGPDDQRVGPLVRTHRDRSEPLLERLRGVGGPGVLQGEHVDRPFARCRRPARGAHRPRSGRPRVAPARPRRVERGGEQLSHLRDRGRV